MKKSTNRSGLSKEKMEQLRFKNPFLSNTELVYWLVRDDIVEHNIKPGTKLNQEQIADELDISRTPVREAFNQLEREGYLSKGVQGYTVYAIKIGDYMALLDLRVAVEALAVRLACSRIRTSEMSKIEKNLDETDALIAQGAQTAWDADFRITDKAASEQLLYQLGLKDQEFHHLVVGSSHNKFVIQAYEDMLPRIHFFRYFALDVNACLNMAARHRMIYEAVIKRDEDLAESRMKTHLNLTVSRAMRY